MKSLVVYYSRTGRTKKVAEAIATTLNCDIEEIIDTKDRRGLFGYLYSGRQTMKNKLTVIKDVKKNPSNYDLLIIGTPVWVRNISVPVRTYISTYKDCLSNVALFCTYGGTGAEKALFNMEKLSGKKSVSLLDVKSKEVKEGSYIKKVKQFAENIKAQFKG